MRSFQGAVLFVDMLGFSALTRGKLTLGAEEYEPWKITPKGDFPHQLLAAQILLAFRKALMRTNRNFKQVKIAQLSDCAFLWSSDLGAIVDAGRYLMHEAVLMGLLCRGGLAVGDIHEPNKVDHSIGAFVVGDAVTRAATYETMGKGMRIFTDSDTARFILKKRPAESFQPLINPLTGDIVDEWQWYAPTYSRRLKRNLTTSREVLNSLVYYHTMFRYSPKFAWNATTPEGCRQLACSITAVSDVMESLSGSAGTYKYSVDQLLLTNTNRCDETRILIHKNFLDEFLKTLKSNALNR